MSTQTTIDLFPGDSGTTIVGGVATVAVGAPGWVFFLGGGIFFWYSSANEGAGVLPQVRARAETPLPVFQPTSPATLWKLRRKPQPPCSYWSKSEGRLRSITNHHSSRPARPSLSVARGSSNK